jgi:hypothetical protein
MSLSNEEQHVLDEIESELRRDDPRLADHLESAPTPGQRHRRFVLARCSLIAGVMLMIVGLGTSRGLVSLGALVAWYGLIIVCLAGGVALHNRNRNAGNRSTLALWWNQQQ